MSILAINFLLLPLVFILAARGRKKKYPDGFVIEKVQERKEAGKSVDPRFVPLYLHQLAYQRYEGWDQVLRKAGLDPEKEKSRKAHIDRALTRAGFDPQEIDYAPGKVHWPEGMVVKILRRRKEEGESIRRKHLPVFISGLITSRFASWDEAVREAGFNPPKEHPRAN